MSVPGDRRAPTGGGELQRLAAVRLAALLLTLLTSRLPTQAAPATAEPEKAAVGAIGDLLRALDERFDRGDVAGVLGVFQPSHPGAHAVLREHTERQVAAATERQRRTQLIAGPRRVGDHLVVRLEQVTRLGPAAAEPCVLRHHALMVLRRQSDGRLVPTLQVDIAASAPCATAERFVCPACNYAVGGVPDWMCAVVAPERGTALEAVSFYLLAADIACDVAVEVAPSNANPLATAARLAATLRELLPGGEQQQPEQWTLPTGRADKTGSASTTGSAGNEPPIVGARCTVDIPTLPPTRSIFHVVHHGGLQHVLLLRGATAALVEHDEAVRALLASFRLLQAKGTADGCAQAALDHHLGSSLQDGHFRCGQFGIRFTGPATWPAEQRSGGAAFRVTWSSSDGSRLWLVGHRPPMGLSRWDQAAADRWLAHLCKKQQLQIAADADGSWQPAGDCGGPTRRLRATVAPGADPALPPLRSILLQLHDDLLIIAEGFGRTDADDRDLQQALGTLRRD